MSLKHLMIHYDGMWMPCPEHGIRYESAKAFLLHNVDPTHIELARLFQLVIKENGQNVIKPERCWYKGQGEPYPHCIKPLHTVEHMRQMFRNMEDVGSDWGFVFFQMHGKIMEGPNNIVYELPPPLCDVPSYDGIENLHQHAQLIQDTMDVLLPAQLRWLNEHRRIPFVDPNVKLT